MTFTATIGASTLVQEYRMSLTADLVTGKLDLPEAAAKLPGVEAEIPPISALAENNETPTQSSRNETNF